MQGHFALPTTQGSEPQMMKISQPGCFKPFYEAPLIFTYTVEINKLSPAGWVIEECIILLGELLADLQILGVQCHIPQLLSRLNVSQAGQFSIRLPTM